MNFHSVVGGKVGERAVRHLNQKQEWIDFGKSLAMIAVILDHTAGVAYKNSLIQYHTMFAVSLFILLAGITSSISISNSAKVDIGFFVNRTKKILVPYFFASLIYSVYFNDFTFDLVLFMRQMVTFSATAAFYFVFFYLQLILCSVFLYELIVKKSKNIYTDIVIMSLIYLFSVYFNRYTNMGIEYGGGSKLLGGSYFFMFCLGILIYKYMSKLDNIKVKIAWFVVVILLFTIFEQNQMYYKSWSNPPNKYGVLYTLLIFSIIFLFKNIVMVKSEFGNRARAVINSIGKNSLYIFLYHPLIIDIIKEYGIGVNATLIFKLFIVLCPLFLPIGMVKIGKQIRAWNKRTRFFAIG